MVDTLQIQKDKRTTDIKPKNNIKQNLNRFMKEYHSNKEHFTKN